MCIMVKQILTNYVCSNNISKHFFAMRKLLFLSIIAIALQTSCTSTSVPPPPATVSISFKHVIDGAPVQLNSLSYTNALGQQYSIKTVKYIISRIRFTDNKGVATTLPDVHFVDINDNNSLDYTLSQSIPVGTYSSVSFVLGLVPENNITASLGIDLDREMAWPDVLGGGYHFMKLEGEYKSKQATGFYNFHTGGLNKTAYEVHVNQALNNPKIATDSLTMVIQMDIANWFKNPTEWDFDYWGPAIMNNPNAQATAQQNGADVFSVIFPAPVD